MSQPSQGNRSRQSSFLPPPPQQQQEDTRSPFVTGLMHGLGSLGDTVNKYYDDKRGEATMGSASDILSYLQEARGGDYALEDVLNVGKKMGAKPDAVKMALSLREDSMKLKGKRDDALEMARHRRAGEEHQIHQEKQAAINEAHRDPMYKAAVKQYGDVTKAGDSMKPIENNIKQIEKLIKSGESHSPASAMKGTFGENSILGRFGKRLESPGAKALDVYGKAMVDYHVKTFGPIRPTILEFLQNITPSSQYRDDQNLAILDVYKTMSKLPIRKAEIARDIFKKQGYIPPDFDILLNEGVRALEEELDEKTDAIAASLGKDFSGAGVDVGDGGPQAQGGGQQQPQQGWAQEQPKDTVEMMMGGKRRWIPSAEVAQAEKRGATLVR